MRFTIEDERLMPSSLAVEKPGGNGGTAHDCQLRVNVREKRGYDVGPGISGSADFVRAGASITVCTSDFRVDERMVLRETHGALDLYQFGCCLEGVMAWRAGAGTDYVIRAGGVALQHVRGGEYESTLPSDQHCRVVSVFADGPRLRASVPEDVLSSLAQGPVLIPVNADMDAASRVLFRSKQDTWQERLLLEARALEFIVAALRSMIDVDRVMRPVGFSPEDFDALLAARSYIEHHVAEKVTIKDLARRSFLNEFKLKQGFRTCFGITIGAYQRACRMRAARRLLLEEGVLVKDAAWRVGYANVSHFIAAYREAYGETPGKECAAGR